MLIRQSVLTVGMNVEEIFNMIPFVEHLGMELTEAADGHAEGELELTPELSSNPMGEIAHGAVPYALADTVGGAAVISLSETVSPTVDMRMDYLAPATDDLYAEADVVREGGSVSVVEVDVYDADDHHVATARGVYKTGGQGSENPWTAGVDESEF
jgi:uncharacterized protein (TIGR00369 family)